MIDGIELLVKGIDTGQLAIPMPSEAVRSWPLIGEKIFQLWSQAASNTEALLLQAAPYPKDIGATLLNISQGVAVGLHNSSARLPLQVFFPKDRASSISFGSCFAGSWDMRANKCCSSSAALSAMWHEVL